ncbi:hypothetical protein HOU03_gp442 [Caulobacter phage CcrSC]|uniref:Uncharacterized protein n=1 Tax=Caulobacter phage CcrSC TaxID=2283272 RepID=A0A385EDR9_9CAUD|nr:hypothetical protein HOU03_gp442 [Caulobacter phage CcrSC]AXQ69826.1 hypothetical protein CcrSC_gp244c [Caulobacter phage CcrSC]
MPTERDDPACIVTSDDAIALREKHNLRAVIIVAIRKDGVIDTATDGDDRWTKDTIATYAHDLMAHQYTIVPMRTAFGVGTDGIPWRCSEEELEGFPQHVRAWIAANTHPKAKP